MFYEPTRRGGGREGGAGDCNPEVGEAAHDLGPPRSRERRGDAEDDEDKDEKPGAMGEGESDANAAKVKHET